MAVLSRKLVFVTSIIVLCLCPGTLQSVSYVAVKTVTGIRGMVYDQTTPSLLVATTSAVQRLTLASNALDLVAGNGTTATYATGSFTDARFNQLWSLAWIAEGHLLTSDYSNCRIRLLDFSTSQVTTYAGNGSATVIDHPTDRFLGAFGSPRSIAWSSSANALYVIDFRISDSKYLIRCVAAGITTVAGGGSTTISNFDQPATSLLLSGLTSLFVSLYDGNVLFTNDGNNNDYVGRFSPTSATAKVVAGDKTANDFNNANPLSGSMNDPQALYVCKPSFVLVESYSLLRSISHIRGLQTVSLAHAAAKTSGQQLAVSPDGTVYTFEGSDVVYRVSDLVCAATDTLSRSSTHSATSSGSLISVSMTPSRSLSQSVSLTKSSTVTDSRSASLGRTISVSPTTTGTVTRSPSQTRSPTFTLSVTCSRSRSNSISMSRTISNTVTQSDSHSVSVTVSSTGTTSETKSFSQTSSATSSPTITTSVSRSRSRSNSASPPRTETPSDATYTWSLTRTQTRTLSGNTTTLSTSRTPTDTRTATLSLSIGRTTTLTISGSLSASMNTTTLSTSRTPTVAVAPQVLLEVVAVADPVAVSTQVVGAAVGLLNPAVAAQAGRLASLSVFGSCGNESALQPPTPTDNPLGLAFGSVDPVVAQHVGSVFGNFVICIIVGVLAGLVACARYGYRVVRAAKDADDEAPTVSSSLGWARYPGTCMFAISLYQANIVSSGVIAAVRADGAAAVFAGVAAIIVSIGPPLLGVWLFRTHFRRHFTVHHEMSRHSSSGALGRIERLMWWFQPLVEWSGVGAPSTDALRQFGLCFTGFTDRAPWFLAVELLLPNTLGAVFTGLAQLGGCSWTVWVVIAVYLSHLALQICLRPYAVPLEQALQCLATATQVLTLVLSAVKLNDGGGPTGLVADVMFQVASAAVLVLAFSDLVETAWAQIRMRIRRKQGALTGHEALLLCPALLDFDESPTAAVDFDEEAMFEAAVAKLETDEVLARMDLEQFEETERAGLSVSERIKLNGVRLLESALAEALATSTAVIEETDEAPLQPVIYDDEQLAARPLLHARPANVVAASDDDDGGAYGVLGSLPLLPASAYALL
jgi:hypothetical protein